VTVTPGQRAPGFAIRTGTGINPSDTQNIHHGTARTPHPDASIAAHIGSVSVLPDHSLSLTVMMSTGLA
jgi:hypothetical protein